MAEVQTQKPIPPKSPGVTSAAQAAESSSAGSGQSVAVSYVGDKKKKRKYSRGLRGPQKLEVSVTRSVHRLARAVEEGLGNWRSNRSKSASKRRDGAIRDALKNYGKAVTKFQKVAAKIPKDMTKSLPSVQRLLKY